MVHVISVLCVVIAYHIYCIRILCFVGHYHSGKCSGGRTRSIDGAYAGDESLGYLADAHGIRCIRIISSEHWLVYAAAVQDRVRIWVVRIIDFIADTPEAYAGVIPVASYHVGDILLNPFFEKVEGTVITWSSYIPSFNPFALREFPFVRYLVHHEQSHLVAEVVKYRCLRIVAHADCIGADSLEILQTPSPNFLWYNSTEHSGIMMETDSFDFHPVPV